MTSLYAKESIVCDGVTSMTSLHANESVVCDGVTSVTLLLYYSL